MSPNPAAPAPAKDPVCGMSVDPASARHKAEHAGTTYFFCSGGCREKFIAEPARYLAAQAVLPPAPPKSAHAGTIYTCPMHPQIRQVGPGHCPICGMALEPEVADAVRGPNAELVDMTRRFWIGARARVAGVALEMGGHLPGAIAARLTALQLGRARARDAGRAVGGLAVLRARLGFAEDPQSQHVHADRAWASGVAWIYSVVATRRARRLFPPAFRSRHGEVAGLLRGRGGHHRAGAAGTGARAARARTDRRRDPRAARPRAKDRAPRPRRWRRGRRRRSMQSRSATGCACGRAKKFRSTAWCSKAAARSTNR